MLHETSSAVLEPSELAGKGPNRPRMALIRFGKGCWSVAKVGCCTSKAFLATLELLLTPLMVTLLPCWITSGKTILTMLHLVMLVSFGYFLMSQDQLLINDSGLLVLTIEVKNLTSLSSQEHSATNDNSNDEMTIAGFGVCRCLTTTTLGLPEARISIYDSELLTSSIHGSKG